MNTPGYNLSFPLEQSVLERVFFGKIALETIQLTILIKLEEIENREGMIS